MRVEEIGSIIRTERIRKGLSCRELGEISDTSAATVCRLETGKCKGSTKAALKILKALDIELDITEEKTAELIVDPDSLYSTVVTGQEIIDFIHNCKLEDTPITRTCDELIFSKRLDTGYGTYEETSLRLNLQSGMYYKVNHSRKIYEYMEETPKTEEQVNPTASTRQKKPKDDDISTYQEYSYMRHPDRVEMGTY